MRVVLLLVEQGGACGSAVNRVLLRQVRSADPFGKAMEGEFRGGAVVHDNNSQLVEQVQ